MQISPPRRAFKNGIAILGFSIEFRRMPHSQMTAIEIKINTKCDDELHSFFALFFYLNHFCAVYQATVIALFAFSHKWFIYKWYRTDLYRCSVQIMYWSLSCDRWLFVPHFVEHMSPNEYWISAQERNVILRLTLFTVSISSNKIRRAKRNACVDRPMRVHLLVWISAID